MRPTDIRKLLIRSPLSFGNREIESRALTGLRFHPDSASVAFDDFLANSQPYAITRILLLRMKVLEDFENPLVALRIDTDAVIADGELPSIFIFLTAHVDLGLFLITEFDGVVD